METSSNQTLNASFSHFKNSLTKTKQEPRVDPSLPSFSNFQAIDIHDWTTAPIKEEPYEPTTLVESTYNHHHLGLKSRLEDAMNIASQHHFNLTIPSQVEELSEKFRFERKFFSIACRSNSTAQDISRHIQNEFNDNLQYVCIARSDEQQIHGFSCIYYIQITLHTKFTKKKMFLNEIAGVNCNYLVTSDDRAWNAFLKKVGVQFEDGQFRSVKSRLGTKWTKRGSRKCKTLAEGTSVQSSQLEIRTKQLLAKQLGDIIIAEAKIFITEAIQLATESIPSGCVHEKQILLEKLNSAYRILQTDPMQ